MEIKYKFHTKFLIFVFLGAIMACSSYLIFVYNPLQLIIKKVMTLSPGSIFLSIWTQPPYVVYINVYIFNVTNHQEFLDGKEKLNFSQAGPYVYQEIITNANPVFNENGTITFAPRRDLVFIREKSVGDPDMDTVTTPNIPLIGISSSLQEASMFTNLALTAISNVLGSQSFLNVTITQYLWGYDDRLVTLANEAIPTWINFKRFGIMDRLMALDNASNIVTINAHPEFGLTNSLLNSDEKQQTYHIHRFNGSPGLKQWGYTDPEGNETVPGNSRCNLVEGSFEGTIFPPDMKKNVSFKLYRRAFCRPVVVNYESELYTKDGLHGYQYRVDQQFLATPEENPENACYCTKNKCLPKGLGSLAPCYYDIPITISQPHFLNSDPMLLEQVNGMKPNKSIHDTTIIISPEIGVPLEAKLRIQINLDVGQTKYNSKTRKFNDLILPLFWLELTIDDVPSIVSLCLTWLYKILPIVQKILIYLLGLTGIALISGSALAIILFTRDQPNSRLSFKGEYSPIPIIPVPIAAQYLRDIKVIK